MLSTVDLEAAAASVSREADRLQRHAGPTPTADQVATVIRLRRLAGRLTTAAKEPATT